MPYTSHGHWYGPGEPTRPGPSLISECLHLDGCATCRQDAGLTMRPEDVPDELIAVVADRLDVAGLARIILIGPDGPKGEV